MGKFVYHKDDVKMLKIVCENCVYAADLHFQCILLEVERLRGACSGAVPQRRAGMYTLATNRVLRCSLYLWLVLVALLRLYCTIMTVTVPFIQLIQSL